MYDENDEWDRYMTRYSGYTPATLDDFVDRGIATYDEAADTYTVRCDHGLAAFTTCTGEATCSETFTVGLRPEFKS